MKIFIAAGHSPHEDNPDSQTFEYHKCKEVMTFTASLLEAAGLEVVMPSKEVYTLTNDQALIKKVAEVNAAGVDLAVELHLNAGGGEYGTTLFWSDPAGTGTESEAGAICAELMASAFDETLLWTQQYDSQSDMGRSLYFLNKTNCPAVIPEPAFMDTKKHMLWIDSPSFVVDYSIAVYQGVKNYLYEIQSEEDIQAHLARTRVLSNIKVISNG